MSGTNDAQREADAETLFELAALILDFTDYLPGDNAEVEKLRSVADELQKRYEERYGPRPQGW